MKKLVMGSLLTAFATTFAGCIFVSDDSGGVCGDGARDTGETCDDGNLINGDGCSASCTAETAELPVTATWSFGSIAFNAAGDNTVLTPTACPGGQFDTVALISQAVDANGQPIGDCGANTPTGTCFAHLYTCTDGTGSDSLPPGEYLQWFAVTSHDGSMVFEQTAPYYTDINGMDDNPTTTFLDDGGYFQASWAITKQGAASSCTAAAVDGVSIDSTVSGSSAAVADTFTCDDNGGLTGGIPDGSYTVSFQALNSGQQAIGPATTLTNKTIGIQNAVTDLGAVTVDVD